MNINGVYKQLNSFSSNTVTPCNAYTSPLFSVLKVDEKKKKVAVHRRITFTSLSMATNGDGLDEGGTKEKKDTTINESSNGADGNLLKNAFLMVPLVLKFVIVLVVKILTDAVVFPLLFLYRAVQLLKRKLVSLISSKSDGKDDESEAADYSI